jgi:hypothetical protein
MKTVFTSLILLLCILLAGGCLTAAPPATGTALPNLTGTWNGPMVGYDEGTGFTNYPDLTLVMVIDEQQGRLFSGHFLLTSNSTEWTIDFAGAIGRDNATLTIAEKDGGYCLGEVIAPDEIELTYMQDGSPYSIAVDSLKRG